MPTAQHLITHPLYAMWQPTWAKALDVYEGTGGFLDETRPYLVPHPREWLDHSVKLTTPDAQGNVGMQPNPSPNNPSPKLKMRRKLARYENVAGAILDTVTGALFETDPTRSFKTPKGNQQVQDFWTNCDGKGTTFDRFMQDSWLVAGVFGHSILFMDKEASEAETQADVRLPRVYRYTPLDLIDWLEDEDGKVTAVKLVEPTPRENFTDKFTALQVRVRVVTEKDWTLYDHSGKKIDSDKHGFGRLPVVFLYGKRRPLTPVIGKSVMGDPQLYIDLYNLTSEVRELLRNQTFGILNVPIGKDGNVESEKDLLGSQSGTANVLFSTNEAAFISPDGANVTMYHEHMDRLGRMIYRLASAPWESDSKDAEAEGSRQLKRQDLKNALTKYAAEMQRADDEVTELVYRALYGLRWKKQQEADAPSTAYPDSFEVPDFEAVAKAASDVIALDPGETAVKEIKKRTTFAYLPDLAPETKKKVEQEIDAMKVETQQEKRDALLQQTAAKFGGRMPPKAPKEVPAKEEPAA